MTPRHLVPLPAGAVHRLCDAIAVQVPSEQINVMFELAAFRDTRTPHDANRLIGALRHVLRREDLAGQVEELLS
jgi:hypothetical protein